MKLEDFNYNLPEELIAQTPLKERTSSKMMVLDRFTGEIEDRNFKDILEYLNPNDILVINNTKVIPARLIGEKIDTHAKIELLLLKDLNNNHWECLSRPFKRLKEGSTIDFGNGLLKAQVIQKKEEGMVEVEFLYQGIFMEILEKLGQMPLPPYIHEKLKEKERYNTVYAKNLGSAAAPTAGLHFTKELLEAIKAKGIQIAEVTLHVGLGTFRPVETENILKHQMHQEFYYLDKKNADILNQAKKEGKRIIAVGTTSTRVLETVMKEQQEWKECRGYTNIFIYPGYQFQAIDGLITNFHLPKSTLIMLVSAFAGREHVLNAYQRAVEKKYRFFSFGDAMLIINKKRDHE